MTRFHARTDVGLKRRHNEDALIALDDIGLFVVADGVGGRKAGELASALTIETFQNHAGVFAELLERFGREPTSANRNLILQSLLDTAQASSRRVFETGAQTGHEGMTTTLVAALCGGGVAFIVHVGDSRAYLLRDGALRQLTEDHSLVNELKAQGNPVEPTGTSLRYKNVITRAIGLYPSVQADTLAVELLDGDRILLCSDGLTDMVSETRLLRHMRAPDTTRACESLVDEALAQGGKDNISVVVIEPDATLEPAAVSARANVMQSLFLFRDLPHAARLRVGRILTERRIDEGEIVVEQDTLGHSLFVVMQGEVAVHLDGSEVARLGAGQHFGELALLEDTTRSASIVACTDTSLLELRRDDLRRYCATEPGVGNRILWRLIEALGERLRQSNQRQRRET